MRIRIQSILASAILGLLSIVANAQESYTLKMSVKIEGLPPEYVAAAEQDIVSYIKGDQLKTERSGFMGGSVVLYDGKKMTAIMEIMGNKMGFTATKQELEAVAKEKSENRKIEYTKDRKMIAGYECTKVILTTLMGQDNTESIVILWITDKINYNHPEVTNAPSGNGMPDFGTLNGYPMGMETSRNAQGLQVKIIMTTKAVSTATIDDAVFAVNTDGYTMMSLKEMQDKQKILSGR